MPLRGRAFSRIDETLAATDACVGVLVVRLPRLDDYALSFGYAAAEGLISLAEKLVATALKPDDFVLRYREGALVAVLPRLSNKNHAELAGMRVARALREPLAGEGSNARLPLAFAIGGAVSPDDGSDAELLCRRAEAACRRAERASERVALYAAGDLDDYVSPRELAAAIAGDAFELYLQPIVALPSGDTVGAEALLRWHHPVLGPIPPAAFVHVAEQAGLIGDLTRCTLNAALRFAATTPGLRVSVNLSPATFSLPGLAGEILSLVRFWGVAPGRLTLEITENAIMEDVAASAALLAELGAQGIAIAIDDFGSGLSSFAYLARFRADEIKIDRAFIDAMLVEPRAHAIVRGMVDVAHALGMRAIAEGVETPAMDEALRAIGCDLAQGYHYGHPVPVERFVAR